MIGSKQSWAELKAENVKLKAKLDELQYAMKVADRHPISYDAHRWIAIPLHAKQKDAVREYFEERLTYCDYKEVDGDRRYEEVQEAEILPEFKRYLIRYTTDAEGNPVDVPSIWGLEPI